MSSRGDLRAELILVNGWNDAAHLCMYSKMDILMHEAASQGALSLGFEPMERQQAGDGLFSNR